MLSTIPISQETVGAAFQQALAAQASQKSKRARRAEFNRLKRTLLSLRLVPSTFDIQYIGQAVDRNGDFTILVVGRQQ